MCGLYGMITKGRRVMGGYMPNVNITSEVLFPLQFHSRSMGGGANGWVRLDDAGLEYHKNKGDELELPKSLQENRYFLGHCRSHQMDLNQNENNHPVVSSSGRVLVMHMGNIRKSKIYEVYDIEPYCTVDTLAIAEVFDLFLQKQNPREAFKNTLEVCRHGGVASVIAIDVANPNLVFMGSDPQYPFYMVETAEAFYVGANKDWLKEYIESNLYIRTYDMEQSIVVQGENLGW